MACWPPSPSQVIGDQLSGRHTEAEQANSLAKLVQVVGVNYQRFWPSAQAKSLSVLVTGNRLGGFVVAALNQHGASGRLERLAVTVALADEGLDRLRQRYVVAAFQKAL